MKRVIAASFVLLIIFMLLMLHDYRSKKKVFSVEQTEFRQKLGWADLLTGKINQYFFEHGWFPDSLQQLDTMFAHRPIEYDLSQTEYSFFVDPFSGNYFYYLPIKGKDGMPIAFYLLSAGIDSKINNKYLRQGGLKIYDSIVFSYFDSYFGRKDLLVSKGSIEDWLAESSGIETSLKWLVRRYDSTGRRALPRSVVFYGQVEQVDKNEFLIKDTTSSLRGVCYLAPNVGKLTLKEGEIIRVKGIYNKINFDVDTTFTFLNCVVLEKRINNKLEGF